MATPRARAERRSPSLSLVGPASARSDPPPIYLDNLATTRLAPEARDAMLPWLDECFGNPASATHALGWAAADAVEEAREAVADLLGVRCSARIVFTSGATESNNTVIRGVHEAFAGEPVHVVTTAIEHPSVLAPCELVSRNGADVSVVPPRRDGIVAPEDIRRAMRPDTRIVSVMAVNNEIGTIQPLAEIGRIARAHGAVFHVDGAQAVAKIEVDVERDGIDFLSVSAHKLHGPKGVGALYCGPTSLPGGLPPLIHGGGQEMGRRSGTPPVAQIVGFGAAARLAAARWRDDAPRIRALCATLWSRLSAEVEGIHLHGHGAPERRVPGCLSFGVDRIDADALIAAVPELALSSGSACSSHHGGGSHVLRALGLPRGQQRGAIRIGIGRLTTAEETTLAADLVIAAIARMRAHRQAA